MASIVSCDPMRPRGMSYKLVQSWMKEVRLKGAGGNMVSLSPRPIVITIYLTACLHTEGRKRMYLTRWDIIYFS